MWGNDHGFGCGRNAAPHRPPRLSVLLLFLNLRYIAEGATDGIAFFIGIYDVLINIGLGADDTAAAMAKCPDNACTVWGDYYTSHASWGVAFHARFLEGEALRTNLLFGHIIFNSIAFVLMHVQLMRPGGSPSGGMHKMLGRVTFLCLTISVPWGALLYMIKGNGGVLKAFKISPPVF